MNQNISLFEYVETNGPRAKGRSEIVRHLSDQKLTFKQAIHAKCYDCMGYYIDGKADCQMPNCPLYAFMPYNPNHERRKRGKQCNDE